MNFLLDTHVFLWWMAADPTLSQEALDAIGNGANTVWLSAASAWEMSIKKALGKLQTPDDLEAALTATGIQPLPINVTHAILAGSLPRIHEDPFDRMLVAQAQMEGLTIITRDERLQRYPIPTLPA